MAFTPAGCGANRSFELVRQSLLQGDSLPFQDALTVEQMQQAFDAEGIAFGEPNDATDDNADDGRKVVYSMGVTLWAMVSQALFAGTQRACFEVAQSEVIETELIENMRPLGETPSGLPGW